MKIKIKNKIELLKEQKSDIDLTEVNNDIADFEESLNVRLLERSVLIQEIKDLDKKIEKFETALAVCEELEKE